MNIVNHGLLSVIVPIYNVEEYLPRCVDSIIGQIYRNLEIILVDDGSLDNCGKICDEYAAKDERIVVIHKTNGGLSDARNAGVEIAKGEYFGFVDSDDYITPDMYEVLMEDIQKTGADIAMCAYSHVYDGKVINKSEKEEKGCIVLPTQEALEYCLTGSISACNKVYRRYLFDDVRYPVGKTIEDAFVIADLFERTRSASINPRQMYCYVHRSNSISTSPFKESDLNLIYAYEHVLEIVRESFPALEDLVRARLLWAHLVVLDKSVLTDEQKLNHAIQKYVRNNIKFLKYGSLFTTKRRLMAIAACVDLRLYRQLIRRYGKWN